MWLCFVCLFGSSLACATHNLPEWATSPVSGSESEVPPPPMPNRPNQVSNAPLSGLVLLMLLDHAYIRFALALSKVDS